MITRTMDQIRERLAENRNYWEIFKSKHPTAFKTLVVGYRVYRSYKHLQYRRIYSEFKAYTMLQEPNYINNLSLCDEYRTVQGAVVECGTWKGGMIAGIAKLLGENREYFLYDSFQGLPAAGLQDALPDGYSAISWQDDLKKPEYADIAERSSLKVDMSFAKEAMQKSGATKIKIVPGWFCDTLSTYDGPPIAILRMDGDFYASIMDTLNNLYSKVVKGGIIIIDDYYYWEGAAKAVHDFLSTNNLADTIHQHRDAYPYIRKKY